MLNRTNIKTVLAPSGRNLASLCLAACLMLSMAAYPAHGQDNATENLRMMGKTFSSVAKHVSPAVVYVKVEKILETQPNVQSLSPFGGDSPFGDDLFQRFFGPSSPQGRRAILGNLKHLGEV
jgi:serine protease Do